MPDRQLPVRPDLEQYKKQAKERRRERGGSLAEAQRAIALEHGLDSWPRFRSAVERLRATPLAPGERITVGTGPFATLEGTVRELFASKRELRVAVRLHGRDVDLWLEERHVLRH